MEFVYDQTTAKQVSEPKPGNEVLMPEFSREHLIQLLTYLEGELEAREVAIQHLKDERAKLICFESRYGLFCPKDPIQSLSRDFQLREDSNDEPSLSELYECQVEQLERLIDVYREAQRNAKHMVQSSTKREMKALRELEKERKEKLHKNEENYEGIVKKRNMLLEMQLEEELEEVSKCKQELSKLEEKLRAEKELKKQIVLFLMKERKELLLTIHTMKLNEDAKETSDQSLDQIAEQAATIHDLKKQIELLKSEKESLRGSTKSLKEEVDSLREIIRSQEEELGYGSRNLTGSLKSSSNDRQMQGERSLVVANRVALGTVPSRTRISSSSSFPAEKSRLPRAPSSPSRPSTASISKAMHSFPMKKSTPAMGISTIRRIPPSPAPPSRMTEPEISQLEAAIEAMTDFGGAIRRSSSLTRDHSDPRPFLQPHPPIVTGTESSMKPPNLNSNAETGPSSLSRLPPRAESAPQAPPPQSSSSSRSRNSLLRAFGK